MDSVFMSVLSREAVTDTLAVIGHG
jgi:hypothetical protein